MVVLKLVSYDGYEEQKKMDGLPYCYCCFVAGLVIAVGGHSGSTGMEEKPPMLSKMMLMFTRRWRRREGELLTVRGERVAGMVMRERGSYRRGSVGAMEEERW